MPQPVIEVQNVTRIYRLGDVDVHALDGVSLVIERGEFVAIMGSSGSGKSTLMNILGCLDRPTSGRYVFEGLNVALPLFYGVSGPARRAERFARAREALRFVGLADRERNTPNQLSGGQQQRVAVARALISGPSVLLADEPTGNLDSRTSHEIMDMLRSLNRDQGVTIVVVTHEADIAAYTDRIVTMRDGRIVADERQRAAAPQGAQRAAATLTFATQHATVSSAAAEGGPFLSFFAMILVAAAQALGRNKMRSALTMLGVFIGVAALIAMVAVGQGANEAVKKQIESLGTNLLVVLPGATTTSGVRGGSGSASTLTVTDALALHRDNPAVGVVSYLIRQLGQVVYGNQNWTTNIQGVTPTYLDTAGWHVIAGRRITAEDDQDAAMVALIGHTVYQQLFGANENAVGAMILVAGKPLRVIGLLAAKGQSTYGQDQDDIVMIPFAAAERKVLGVATAQLYPNVTLTASWTQAAASAGALFAGSNSLWSVGAGLTAPLFHGGTLTAQRREAIDAFAAQLGIYRQTVLQAFGQVADTLQALEHDATALDAQREALDTAQASLELSQESYKEGQASFLQVLQAQRLFGQARLGYALAKSQRYLDTTQLFEAMGGAWRDWKDPVMSMDGDAR